MIAGLVASTVPTSKDPHAAPINCHGLLSTRLRRRLVAQAHRPTGPLGRVVAQIMATRPSNVERNRWAVDQLAVGPTDRVLEIGFGPGVAIEALVARVTEGYVWGVDHSDLMVRKAARRNAQAIAEGRLRLTQASVADVDETRAPLDLILAVNNLGMWPDPPTQLKRLQRLLRPGGRIAIGAQPEPPAPTPTPPAAAPTRSPRCSLTLASTASRPDNSISTPR